MLRNKRVCTLMRRNVTRSTRIIPAICLSRQCVMRNLSPCDALDPWLRRSIGNMFYREHSKEETFHHHRLNIRKRTPSTESIDTLPCVRACVRASVRGPPGTPSLRVLPDKNKVFYKEKIVRSIQGLSNYNSPGMEYRS
jgi:hypothetical protein